MKKNITIRTKVGLTVYVSKLRASKKDKKLLHMHSLNGENIGFINLDNSRLKFEGSNDYSKDYILVDINNTEYYYKVE